MKKTILSFSFLIIFLKHWNELADLGLKYYESFPDTLRLNDKVFSWEKAANTSMPMLRNENYLLWRLIDENKDPKGWPENFLEPKGDKTGPEIKIISEALVDQD